MILHTLNASPGSSAFNDCLRVITPGDSLLLMGDGVYAAIADTDASRKLGSCGAHIHVLQQDAVARGVDKLVTEANRVDLDGFVTLTEQYPRQQAWY